MVRPARRRASNQHTAAPQNARRNRGTTVRDSLSLASTIMTLLAPKTSSSTRAFHGLGCLDSCCQVVGMCEEADIRTHENTSSDHDSINMEKQKGSSAANEAMELFSALLTGLSAANLMNGQGTDAVLQDVALIVKHWERLIADKENSTPIPTPFRTAPSVRAQWSSQPCAKRWGRCSA